jgi:hypothetical protein
MIPQTLRAMDCSLRDGAFQGLFFSLNASPESES